MNETPLDLVVRVLHSLTNILFPLRDKLITDDWSKKVYSDWLPRIRLKSNGRLSIQRHDHQFKGLDRIFESELEVLIPDNKEEARVFPSGFQKRNFQN